MFTFDNFALTIVIALIAMAWLSFFSVIIGGLGLSTVLTLFVTPVLYDLLARLTRPRSAVARELEDALAIPGNGKSVPAE